MAVIIRLIVEEFITNFGVNNLIHYFKFFNYFIQFASHVHSFNNFKNSIHLININFTTSFTQIDFGIDSIQINLVD